MLRLIASLLLIAAGPAPAAPSAPRQDWAATVARTPEGGVRQGNPDAPLKLVEYGSRSCPTCGRFAREGVGPLRARYVATGRVSYEFRDFLVHPQDAANALLGRCVPTARFFPVLDAMFDEQAMFNARGAQLSEAEIARIAALRMPEIAAAWARAFGYDIFMQRHGMSAAQVGQCLADPAGIQSLGRVLDGAAALGVRGTPTFFLNGRRLENVYTWGQLEPLLRAGS